MGSCYSVKEKIRLKLGIPPQSNRKAVTDEIISKYQSLLKGILLMPRTANTETVIHNWTHSRKLDSRNPRLSEAYESSNCSRTLNDDGTGLLYSYSTVIAVKVGLRAFLISTHTYSVTSSKHQTYCYRSAFGTIIYVPNVEFSSFNDDAHKENLDYLCDNIRDTAFQVIKGTGYNPSSQCNKAVEQLDSYLKLYPQLKKYLKKPYREALKFIGSLVQADQTAAIFKSDFEAAEIKRKAASKAKTLTTKIEVYQKALGYFEQLASNQVVKHQYKSLPASVLLETSVQVKRIYDEISAKGVFNQADYNKASKLKSIKHYPLILSLVQTVQSELEFYNSVYRPSSYSTEYRATQILLTNASLEAANPDWTIKNKLSAYRESKSSAHLDLASVLILRDELREPFQALPSTIPNEPTVESIVAMRKLSDLFSQLYRPFLEASGVAELIERQKRAEYEKLQNAEKIELWRSGANVHLPYSVGDILRIKADDIESSRGCRVPIKFARYVFSKLVRYFNGELTASELPRQWGPYTFLPEANADLSVIVVGCHRIAREEIFNIAEKLGLDTLSPTFNDTDLSSPEGIEESQVAN